MKNFFILMMLCCVSAFGADWTKIDDVAQYKEADWSNVVQEENKQGEEVIREAIGEYLEKREPWSSVGSTVK